MSFAIPENKTLQSDNNKPQIWIQQQTPAEPNKIPQNTNNNKHLYHICNRNILELDNPTPNIALNTIKMVNNAYTPIIKF